MRGDRVRLLALVAVCLAGGGSQPAQAETPAPPPAPAKKIDRYIPAHEQIGHFAVPEGFTVELVVAEPTIINPVCIALDEQGRLYVSESHTYRYHDKGTPLPGAARNPIVRLDPLPDGKGFRRVLVADGFDDPVMGMAIRGNQLWATANNYLYRFDIDDSGLAAAPAAAAPPATATDEAAAKDVTAFLRAPANQPIGVNRQTIAVDKNKAWNPFGMFVLEWGPEGDLYMSLGNGGADIRRTADEKERISKGPMVMRMKADGSKMERLVGGLRVPYGFEYDPFGQLWQLSNGEGNPNRFIRVIEGVDYHLDRGVGNEWLAGRHPLAPPCFELPRGSCTQLMRYYGANFPAAFQGSLLVDNWGSHGFNGANRTIFRFVPDDRNDIAKQEEFIVCRDPHFRCSHVICDRDGSLLVADWYGRDDESDLTGRVWRVRYTGSDKPVVQHRLDAPDWKDAAQGRAYAVAALGSPDHLVRQKATRTLVAQANDAIPALAAHAAGVADSLGAANALWALVQIATPESFSAIDSGVKHGDWRVRRLAINLLRRFGVDKADAAASQLAGDADPAVRVAAARARVRPEDRCAAAIAALKAGAAADVHLRYEAASILAPVIDEATLTSLVRDSDPNLRLAGLIAIDRGAPPAAVVLGRSLADPGPTELDLLLTLAQLHRSPAVLEGLRALVRRADLPAGATGQALLVLHAMTAQKGEAVDGEAVRRFLEAAEAGEIALKSSRDKLTLLELLETDGPSPFALQTIGRMLDDRDRDGSVRAAAHRLARLHGTKAAPLADAIWARVADPNDKRAPADRLADLTTLMAVEAEPKLDNWARLLTEGDPVLVADALRSWRQFAGNPKMTQILQEAAAALVKRLPELQADLATVAAALKIEKALAPQVELPAAAADDAVFRTAALAATRTPAGDALGRGVFERTGCVKCHAAGSQGTERAPPLAGIGKAQKIDYLIESVLEPSKIIKTGFEIETITLQDGRVLNGLVKDEKDTLRIVMPDGETRVKKEDIDERIVQKKSLMPDGQHRPLSPREFADLVGYLQSL